MKHRDWSVLVLALGLALIFLWGVYFYGRVKAGIERQLAQRQARMEVVQ